MCYEYPDELISLIESGGFRVFEKWGGYAGENYGEDLSSSSNSG
jgi:hypothetical protein